MNTPLKKEKAARETLSGFEITQRNNNSHFVAVGIFTSLALLIALTIITLIAPHFFWGHFLVINYPLHSTIETIGAVSAILMAFLLMDIFTEKINPSYVFISMGFLGMGIWDLFHATVPPGDGFVLTHSIALLIGGFFFFLSIFPAGETIIRNKARALFFAAVFFVFAAVLTVVFRPYLPQMIGEGGAFTRTADMINIAAGSLFLLTAAKLSVDYYRHRTIGITILVFVATLSALAGLTFHYSHAWTDNWWFWHVLRLCAHISLVIYLLVEFLRLMKERSAAILLFEQKNDELAASEQTLKALNQQLISNQQRLVEEKKRFETLFDSEPDAIFIAEPETGILIDVNQAAVKLTRYPAEKLVGMHQSLLHPEKMREKYGEKFREIAFNSSREPQEVVIQDADGNIVPVEVVGNVVKVAGKKIVIGIFRDITSRKELEEQKEAAYRNILTQNQLTDSILDSLPGIFYQIGMDGQYKRWNKKFLEVTGLTDEEMQATNAVDFFREDDINHVAKAMETVFTQGESEVEADLHIKSGESIPYLFTGVKFEIEDTPYILGMGLDISNLRSTQNKLTRTVQELETFNKMAVGRELRMIELKAKINSLSKELGKKAPYDLQFTEQDS